MTTTTDYNQSTGLLVEEKILLSVFVPLGVLGKCGYNLGCPVGTYDEISIDKYPNCLDIGSFFRKNLYWAATI